MQDMDAMIALHFNSSCNCNGIFIMHSSRWSLDNQSFVCLMLRSLLRNHNHTNNIFRRDFSWNKRSC